MTPTAPAGSRRLLTSTRGGRSVQRAATAVQGASLPTLPLVRAVSLAVLTDPLGALLAGPPDLALLGETASRAAGDRAGAERARSHPARLDGAPPPQPRSVPAATSASAPGRLRQAPPPATPAAQHPRTHPDLTRLARSDLSTDVREDATSRRARPPGPEAAAQPDLGASLPLPAGAAGTSWPPDPSTGPSTGPSPDRSTGPSPDRSTGPSTGRPRGGTGRGGDARNPAPSAARTPGVDARVDERPAVPRATVTGSDARSSAPAGAAAVAPAAEALGALGELLSRWQEPTAAPDTTAPSPSTSPFAPLSTAATTGFTTPAGAPGPDDGEQDLDRVQLALDELLRREVEQHGLDGGLV